MKLSELFSNGDGNPLPKANVSMRLSGDEGDWTPEQVRGIICNPIYAGIGPFNRLVTDEEWVHAVAREIQKEGAEQVLVNMLHLLRGAFENASIEY